MAAIVLDEHRSLFRNEAAFNHFVSFFEDAARNSEISSVWAKKRNLATLFSPASAKFVIHDRILQKLSDDPAILDEMRDRLENDDIVE